VGYIDDFVKDATNKAKSEAQAAIDQAKSEGINKLSEAQANIEIIRSQEVLPDDYPGPDITDPLNLGKELLDYTDEEFAQFERYDDLLKGEQAIRDQEARCDAIGEQFQELSDKIDELSDKFDAIVDKLTDKICNFFGVAAVEVKFKVEYALLLASIRKDLPSTTALLDSLRKQLPFGDELNGLIAFGYDTFQYYQKIQQLKNKYGNSDAVIDAILDDPKGFLQGLGGDLAGLCKELPQWEDSKTAQIKIRVAEFGLEGPEIDIKEIIMEGASPFVSRIEEILAKLGFSIDKVHDYYDKYDQKADGKCSWTDC